jgi:hypothetical protein
MVLCAVWSLFLPEHAPVLAGRTVAAWRAELRTNFRASLDLDRELQRAGTNALPFLIAAARQDLPAHQQLYRAGWQRWIQHLPTEWRRRLQSPRQMTLAWETLRQVSFAHLVQLGPAATPAIPELIRVLSHGEEPFAAWALEVFGGMGPAAQPALPAIFRAQNRFGSEFRLNIVRVLGKIAPTNPAVGNVLIERLNDTPPVALLAARILQSNQLEMERVVAALMQLLKLENVRASEAATLLVKYGPGAAPAVPSLIEMLQASNTQLKVRAALVLGELGEIAAAAEPALRAALHDDYAGVREAAAAALKKMSRLEG